MLIGSVDCMARFSASHGNINLKGVVSCTAGVVVFDNVWMKYAPKAPYALKEVSFAIQAAEKVGVVGRTGSGKSTLLLALYRMFNLDLGRILIDNVDIASLTLLKLRRSLSIIPQVWGQPHTLAVCSYLLRMCRLDFLNLQPQDTVLSRCFNKYYTFAEWVL